MPHPTQNKQPCTGRRCAEHSPGKHRAYPWAVFEAVSGKTLRTFRTAQEARDAVSDGGPDWIDYADTREESDVPAANHLPRHAADGGVVISAWTREFGDWS